MNETRKEIQASIVLHTGRADMFRKNAAASSGVRRDWYMGRANEEEMRAVALKVKLTNIESTPTDGPCGQFQWRQNGVFKSAKLQAAAWKMVKHLWDSSDRVATFDELKIPVYDDREHLADENTFGSLRRAANNYFNEQAIPLKVSLRNGTVSLQPKK